MMTSPLKELNCEMPRTAVGGREDRSGQARVAERQITWATFVEARRRNRRQLRSFRALVAALA